MFCMPELLDQLTTRPQENGASWEGRGISIFPLFICCQPFCFISPFTCTPSRVGARQHSVSTQFRKVIMTTCGERGSATNGLAPPAATKFKIQDRVRVQTFVFSYSPVFFIFLHLSISFVLFFFFFPVTKNFLFYLLVFVDPQLYFKISFRFFGQKQIQRFFRRSEEQARL